MMGKLIRAWHFTDGPRTRYDNQKIKPGKILQVSGDLVMCVRGLHASRNIQDALKYAPGNWVWRVELSGDVLHNNDKMCASERSALWGFDATDVLRRFACLCALDVTNFWDPPVVVLQYLRTRKKNIRDAARDAAWAATRAAARDAARDAAWDAARDAAWAAAWDAARDAAWAAARAAARDAARAAARDAARAAAWAAARAATRAAARDAARAAAWDAAWDAAWAAARAAAWDAARAAAWAAARDAARAAAWAAARRRQTKRLARMIHEERRRLGLKEVRRG